MLISLVTSTIGRPKDLEHLMDSLVASDARDTLEFILVDQSSSGECADLVQGADLPFPVRTARSSTGLSHGRNVGLGLARGEIVAFPDDDCFYASSTIGRAVALMNDPALAGISGMQHNEHGDPVSLRWPASARDVTPRNFYRTAISSTLFLRRDVVAEVGGFDETLGVGSKRGYMSGEESDIVLKILAAGHRIRYEPSVVVHVEDDGSVPPGYEGKMAGYGRGFGRLFKQHALGRGRFEVLLARKDVGARLRHLSGRRELARADMAFTRAAREGYRAWR